MKHIRSYDKVFLTGCDKTTEWMLLWFLKNFHEHNKKIPIIIGDFGLNYAMKYKLENEMGYQTIDMSAYQHLKGWFKKPQVMLECPSEQTVWIDTDCEVLGNIEGIFNLLVDDKLNMVQDLPWTARTQETWHNSGVVGFKGKPEILRAWAHKVTMYQDQGDQEVLHSMFNDDIHRLQYINSLPNIFNWLRVQLVDNHDNIFKKVMHWTGRKGKLKIQEKIRNG
jgi:hypothetical protein